MATINCKADTCVTPVKKQAIRGENGFCRKCRRRQGIDQRNVKKMIFAKQEVTEKLNSLLLQGQSVLFPPKKGHEDIITEIENNGHYLIERGTCTYYNDKVPWYIIIGYNSLYNGYIPYGNNDELISIQQLQLKNVATLPRLQLSYVNPSSVLSMSELTYQITYGLKILTHFNKVCEDSRKLIASFIFGDEKIQI